MYRMGAWRRIVRWPSRTADLHLGTTLEQKLTAVPYVCRFGRCASEASHALCVSCILGQSSTASHVHDTSGSKSTLPTGVRTAQDPRCWRQVHRWGMLRMLSNVTGLLGQQLVDPSATSSSNHARVSTPRLSDVGMNKSPHRW